MDKFILGKGLQSLIPPKKSGQPAGASIPQKDDEAHTNIKPKDEETKTDHIFYLETNKIKSNPHQPRKKFDKEKLQELADSIKEHGILQPLVISKTKAGEYQLIVGQRRLEAAKIVGLSHVPVIIRDSSEQEKLELALVENLQRDNLNPIEKAYAFKKLIDEFHFIQEDIAKRMGKSRETVANTLRLLDLPAEIQRAILESRLSEGHGRAILGLSNVEKELLLFKEILKNGLSVRQAEALAKKIAAGLPKKSKTKSRKDSYLRDLENKLSDVLGTRVKLTRKGKKGKITIEFFSQEELDGIVKRICKR